MKKVLFFSTILFLIILLLVFTLKYNRESFKNNNEKVFAIHTVFISKENILFLEEWLDYHIQLGFNKFYLYDNSKVTKKSAFDSKNKNLKPGKVNKYNINYDELVNLNQSQVNEIMDKIVKKYDGKVNIIEWSPKDKDGNVLYNQQEAHNHCLKRMKLEGVKWCASIDIDEFIVIKKKGCESIYDFINKLDPKVSNLSLEQIRFQNRFENIDKNVVDIDMASKKNGKFLNNYNSYKNIFKVEDTTALSVHTWKGKGKQITTKDILFNHYKLNDSHTDKFHILNNIDEGLKSHIHKNSKHYIKNEYL